MRIQIEIYITSLLLWQFNTKPYGKKIGYKIYFVYRLSIVWLFPGAYHVSIEWKKKSSKKDLNKAEIEQKLVLFWKTWSIQLSLYLPLCYSSTWCSLARYIEHNRKKGNTKVMRPCTYTQIQTGRDKDNDSYLIPCIIVPPASWDHATALGTLKQT